MQRSSFFLLIGMTALLSACASVNSKIYSETEILQISSWVVDFAYESGSVETIKKTTSDGELKVVRSGQLHSDLELRDDLFFMLKDDYSIPITKQPIETSGKILIHPIHFRSGGFKSLTVTLVNNKGDVLARLKIKNGDRKATYKDEEDFSEYSANAIAQAIKKK